jgi:hypothetical protein
MELKEESIEVHKDCIVCTIMVVNRKVGHCLVLKPAAECSLRKLQKLKGLKRKHMKCKSWNKLVVVHV